MAKTADGNDTLDGTPTKYSRQEFGERLEMLLDQGRTDEADKLIDDQYPEEEGGTPTEKPLQVSRPRRGVRDLSSLKKGTVQFNH